MAEFNPDWDVFNPAYAGQKVNKPAPTFSVMGARTRDFTPTSTTGSLRPSITQPTSSPKSTLDAIAAQYMSGGGLVPENLPRENAERVQQKKGEYAIQNALQERSALQESLDAMMYRTVGGPNAALIASLQAQKKQLQTNYGQNKADANNLYGELSSDIETYGAGLQERYQTSMDEMATAQTTRQGELAGLQSQRDADRARVAASLGIAAEDAQAPQSTALQEIAGLSSAAASNWDNLFRTNKLLADASTGRQVAGAGATKANQLMAMKRYLDAQTAAIDSEISMERMKAPTQELTDIGKALRSLEVDQLVSQAQAAFPERYGAGKEESKTDLMEGFATAQQNISSLYGELLSQDQILEEFYEISRKKMEAQMYGPSEESQLTPLQIIISNSLNLRESDFG